jgi:hypothetical protein
VNGPTNEGYLTIEICPDGAQNSTESVRGGGVTIYKSKKSKRERGKSSGGPVYAGQARPGYARRAKAHCKDHPWKAKKDPAQRALPKMARSKLEREMQMKKNKQIREGVKAIEGDLQ